MFEISRHGGDDDGTEVQENIKHPARHISKNTGKNLLDDAAELPQHKHIDEQVLPIGMDEAVREKTVPLARHFAHGDGVENELALYLGIAERLNGNQRGEDNDDDGKAHAVVEFFISFYV